jgi:NitT/TauT family transport system substrate-binding protein
MREIRIGHLSTAYHTSLVIMGAHWIEKKMNLKPLWRLFGGGPGIVEAFADEELDIGYVGLPPVIIGIDKGVPIKCIAGGHVEGTVFLAREGFKSVEEQKGDVRATLGQFRGRIVGSPPKGSIHDVIIRNLLKKYGFSDIKIKNFRWADFIPDALERGEIEAAVGTPALAVVARQIARIAIPPDKLWPNNPSYGIVASHKLIEDSPDIIEGFLRLHEDATNLIRTSPGEGGRIVSKTMGVVSKEFVLQVYKVSPRYCASISDEFIDSTLKFVPVLKELDYIAQTLTKEDIFDLQFIERVHPEAPHY